jgi:hypothetical protein
MSAPKSILTCWFTGGDLVAEIHDQDIARYYAPLSWHCLLAGYGVFPDDKRMTATAETLPLADMKKIDHFINSCASNFSPHAATLVDKAGHSSKMHR